MVEEENQTDTVLSSSQPYGKNTVGGKGRGMVCVGMDNINCNSIKILCQKVSYGLPLAANP